MKQYMALRDGKVVIEDVQELPFDAANIATAKDPSTHGPVYILQGSVVGVL